MADPIVMFWWALEFVCLAFSGLYITAGAWCLVKLCRNWRTVPELWGIDWLDIVFRVESEFGVTFTSADFVAWTEDARMDLTAGQLWVIIADKLRLAGASVPADGWERLAAVMSVSLNVPTSRISAESRLYADLGMERGL